MTDARPVVLGGGACGLAAAWEFVSQDATPIVVEKNDSYGGMLSHVAYNGNHYEYGTHVFHTDDETLRNRIVDLMGDKIFSFERAGNLHIKFMDKYFRYPLNGLEVLQQMPIKTSVACVLSLIYANIMKRFRSEEPTNSAEVLINRFGIKLYDIFFKDYTKKFWGIPSEELDAKFAYDRIPSSDVFQIIRDVFEKLNLGKIKTGGHPLSERALGCLYYCPDGLHTLCESIVQEITKTGADVLTSTMPTSINVSNGKVCSVTLKNNEKEWTVDSDYVIGTIPIRYLVPLLNPAPPQDVLDAASRLKFLPLTVCGLLVDKERVRDAICTYYRQKVFNRLSEPTFHGLQTTPKDKTILLAEMTDYTLKQLDLTTEQSITEQVIEDLCAEGLIDRTQVLDSCVYRYNEAYPIYDVGYANHLKKVQDYLAAIPNLASVGRQGSFLYVNTHVTMRMGMDAAREALSGKNS